ncbi:MAG: hypothetical protein GXP27_06990 [Planctomycetes bacterium]|nr:hypothetical protein [Planctomycetota bacterium]
MQTAVLVAVWTAAGLAVGASAAPDGVDRADNRTPVAEAVRSIEQRSRFFQTGIFRARGRIVEDLGLDGKSVEEHETPVSIYAAFDWPGQRFRFDTKRSYWLPDRTYEAEFQFVSTQDRVIKRGRPKNTLIVYPAGEPPDRRTGMFNIRSLGLANCAELMAATEPQRFFNSDGILSTKNVIELEQVEPTLVKITWQFGPDNEARRTIWFDTGKGWVPIRLEERYLVIEGDPPRAVPGKWSEPEHVCQVTWARGSGGAWVPRTAVLTHRAGMFLADVPHHDLRRWELEFEWESVNKPIDDTVFSIEGMDGPDRTSIVVDKTLGGRPTITQFPGKKAEEV